METRSVSRCIAIAAHGKRCQQSPFRGSPYCWHHTQSRKVWPPSRPAVAAAGVGERPRAGRPGARRIELPVRRDLRDTARALSRDMIDSLDEDTLSVLVDFLESQHSGALILAREGGRVVVAEGGPPRRHRRAAAG